MTPSKDLASHMNSTTTSPPDQQEPSTSNGTSMQTAQHSEELQELLIAIQVDINMYSAGSLAGRTLPIPQNGYFPKRMVVEKGAVFDNVNATVQIQKDLKVQGLLRVCGNLHVQGTVKVKYEARLGREEEMLDTKGPVMNFAQGEVQTFNRPLLFSGDAYRFDQDFRSTSFDEIIVKGDLTVNGNIEARTLVCSGYVHIHGGTQYGEKTVQAWLDTTGKNRNTLSAQR